VDEDIGHRLESLEQAVSEAVRRRSSADPNPNDSFRGLYVSRDMVELMLDDGPSDLYQRTSWQMPEPPPGSTLDLLAKRCGLTDLDIDLLMVLLAPEVDPRFERFYAYLHDDIARRLASPGLALELCGRPLFDAASRSRFDPAAPLRHRGLVVVDNEPRPLMTRSTWLPEPVVQHLLGQAVNDPDLEIVRTYLTVSDAVDPMTDALSLLEGGVVVLPNRIGEGLAERAIATLDAAGYPEVVVIDSARATTETHKALITATLRQLSLRQAGLIVLEADTLPARVLREISETDAPTFFIAADPPSADWTSRPFFVLNPDTPTAGDRASWWDAHLTSAEAGKAPVSLRLGPSEIARTVETATAISVAAGDELDGARLSMVANRAARSGLHRLARHVEPSASWENLIVTPAVRELLQRIASRVAHRDLVMGSWGLGRGGGRGEGTTALFAGPSGTGKTLAAEVIAKELGFDLYVVDLSSVVDKYIGETEKNLERIFHEAEATNAILFFDEADALFGKRSEVSDAKDRYANIEVAYLLQRMETFDGVSILATNLKANLDEAFTRRLSLIVEFKAPEPDARLALWKLLLGDVPIADDVDLELLATEYDLAGGTIRSAIETAAYLAAAAGSVLEQATLLRSVQHEYEKAGRLWRG